MNRIMDPRAVGALALALLGAGCAGGDPSYMSGYGRITDFQNAGKAVVIIDGEQGSALLLTRHVHMLFSTIDGGQPVMVDGKTVIQDKFETLNFPVPVAIAPGRYAFLAYMTDAGAREIANIGGWTTEKQPLLAGFEVKAGEVIYLGHLVFTYGSQGDQDTMRVQVEDRSAKDSQDIKSDLDRQSPGASEKLQTRLITIYRSEVPTKSTDLYPMRCYLGC
jgi:hypothetical protein